MDEYDHIELSERPHPKKHKPSRYFLLPIHAFVIAGALTAVYQVYSMARWGTWHAMYADTVLRRILPVSFFNWLLNTSSFVGLKNVLSWITTMPLFAFFIACGIVYLLLYCLVWTIFTKKSHV
jgi:hypothetical protein